MPGPYEGKLRVLPESEIKASADAAFKEMENGWESDGSIEDEGLYPVPLELRADLLRSERAVIVCGPNCGAYGKDVRRVANWLRIPVLTDVLSDLRCSYPDNDGVIGAYDAFLRSPGLVECLKPDFILRIGGPPTSKPLATYLQKYSGVPQLLIAPEGSWPDPDVTAHAVIHRDPGTVFSGLADNIEPAERDSSWLTGWQRAESTASSVTRSLIEGEGAMSEPAVFTELAKMVPTAYDVFAGNSMPVRDLDSFWPVSENINFFHANRGASGIDGVVSTALGKAAVSYGMLVLVIGDLSFYHDMNGLLAAKRFGLKATIVLVNNDGGGIFSFLPQNDDQEHFEQLFGTPHGLDFEPVAQLYGLGWTRVTTREEYRSALMASFESDGVNVIEVKTDRVENLRLHQRIWAEVAKAVEPLAPQAAK
jgi:2-succinyl-5-enolpyruvyl-6-hydroxy-3-cyclohexene-1-carboxylate synthase